MEKKRFDDLQLLADTMERMNDAENFVDVANMIFEFIKNRRVSKSKLFSD